MQIIEIAKKIKENGGNLYLVGGAVRDKLLKRKVNDEDYCVTGITQDKFIELFPKAHIRGIDFEVFDLGGKEFALARRERKVERGHKGFKIETKNSISIEEDLKRRDITINSMAEDVLTGKLIDPYKGKKDIEQKILRATTEKFREDPLRVYRIARFAAELGFTIEENTIEMMKSLKSELFTLPRERIFIEFRKALASQRPSVFFESLKKANLLDIHFLEINQLIGSLQPIKFHPEGDSYNHTMVALDKSVKLTKRLEVRYGVLVHDLGKGATPKEIQPHHYGHEIEGVFLAQKLSDRLGVPKLWKKCAIIATKEHMRAGIFEKMKPEKQVDLLVMLNRSALGLEGMQVVVECDKTSSETHQKNTNFAHIGKCMLKSVNGKTITLENIKEEDREIILKKERIKWLKNLQSKLV